MPEIDVVTGAFGYTGRYIARRLLALGQRVRTITGHPERPNPFGGEVAAFPFDFDQPAKLVETLRGATTLYNTYWVRFSHGAATFGRAVENTRVLIRAAEEAGVQRIVHVSITNPSEDSPLPYFRGKAVLERVIAESRLSYAIVRPTVIFGPEDILINNIAWLLRRFPAFPIAGTGRYRLQPIFVEDMAEIAVGLGQREDNVTVDAVGPDTFEYEALVRRIGEAIGVRRRIVHVRPGLALLGARLVGLLVRDVVLTQDEMDGLMAGLLVSAAPPLGKTRLGEWLQANAATVGNRYASELGRHYR